jgi:DNA-binding NarL/FixJ family response regulator
MLESSANIDVIGEVDNGRAAVEMVRQLHPDVLVLDMELPELNGALVMRQIRLNRLPVRVLVLSSYDDPDIVKDMLGAGASAYVTKREAPETLVSAVHKVATSQGYAPAVRVYAARQYEVV